MEIYITLNLIQLGGLGLVVFLLQDLRERIRRLEDLHLKNRELRE